MTKAIAISTHRSIHETQLVLAPPIKTPTPYGGRLTWTLPGGNLLYVHVKDKNKIRHKKRWSQVSQEETEPPEMLIIPRDIFYL